MKEVSKKDSRDSFIRWKKVLKMEYVRATLSFWAIRKIS